MAIAGFLEDATDSGHLLEYGVVQELRHVSKIIQAGVIEQGS
jgi:hypothetical protein